MISMLLDNCVTPKQVYKLLNTECKRCVLHS
nr:MAG TPA: hypothetical protein [Bacteriophage sp.]